MLRHKVYTVYTHLTYTTHTYTRLGENWIAGEGQSPRASLTRGGSRKRGNSTHLRFTPPSNFRPWGPKFFGFSPILKKWVFGTPLISNSGDSVAPLNSSVSLGKRGEVTPAYNSSVGKPYAYVLYIYEHTVYILYTQLTCTHIYYALRTHEHTVYILYIHLTYTTHTQYTMYYALRTHEHSVYTIHTSDVICTMHYIHNTVYILYIQLRYARHTQHILLSTHTTVCAMYYIHMNTQHTHYTHLIYTTHTTYCVLCTMYTWTHSIHTLHASDIYLTHHILCTMYYMPDTHTYTLFYVHINTGKIYAIHTHIYTYR